MEFDPVERAKHFLETYNQIQVIGDALLIEDIGKSKPYNHEKPDEGIPKIGTVGNEVKYDFWLDENGRQAFKVRRQLDNFAFSDFFHRGLNLVHFPLQTKQSIKRTSVGSALVKYDLFHRY